MAQLNYIKSTFIIIPYLQIESNPSHLAAQNLPLPHLVLRMTIDLSPPNDLLILYEKDGNVY